ncbi:MAG: S-layer homology domain-containing protein [Oscillospiraceae bacterium]
MTGKTPDRFDPDAPVTREQIAAVLCTATLRLSGGRYLRPRELEDYSDAHRISRYAVDAISWAVAAGLLQGVDSDALAPKR